MIFVGKNIVLILSLLSCFIGVLGINSYSEKNKRIKYDFYQLEMGAKKVSLNKDVIARGNFEKFFKIYSLTKKNHIL